MKPYIIVVAIALIVAQGVFVAWYARKIVVQVRADQAAQQYQKEVYDYQDAVFPIRNWQI